jgi:hypothetical protein
MPAPTRTVVTGDDGDGADSRHVVAFLDAWRIVRTAPRLGLSTLATPVGDVIRSDMEGSPC